MSDSPTYGTCPRCGQPGPINKYGRRRPHTRREVHGSMVLTIRCANGVAPEFDQWRQGVSGD